MDADLSCYTHTVLCRLGNAGIALMLLSVPAMALAVPINPVHDLSPDFLKKIFIGGIVALIVGFFLWLFSPANCSDAWLL